MKNVEIYTSPTCGYCHEAMEFFQENKVDYVEHDIAKDKDAKRTLMKKGYMSVPVIVIDGEEILGFDKEKLTGILGL
jgi:glutaredoxin 3